MIGQRVKQLRLARGMSLDELAMALGGAVTKQALSKYELGKSQPSPRMLTLLANALGVKASHLAIAPSAQVEFIGYRRRASLPKREQERVESQIAEALEQRVLLHDRLQVGAILDLAVQSVSVKIVEDAELAAEQIRNQWKLGTEPLANVTATLEDHLVHVLEIDGDHRFDGLSAIARDSEGQVEAAAVICDRKVPGERQRLNLAHELGHLVLDVSMLADDQIETAAFRFGAALLAPRNVVLQDVGQRRRHVTVEELLLLKKRFGMSIQALLHRLRSLSIITESYYKEWCININRLGWRNDEPARLPREEPTWLRRQVLRGLAEELLSDMEAVKLLPDLAEVERRHRPSQRQAFMALPLEQRRRIMAEQADQIMSDYVPDSDWQDLNADDIIDNV